MRELGEATTPGSVGLLLGAFLGPPLVWLAGLQAAYSFASLACDHAWPRWPIALVLVVAAGAVVATIGIAWRAWRSSGGGLAGDDLAGGHRTRFLAIGGVVLGAQFLAVLAVQALAAMVLAPCH